MNFLNPLALIGLVAATIPLILHLLNLRKLKIIEFSSLRFLKELQKTKIRRLKLKQIILLILRTLIIICIVIAFARPAFEGTLPAFGSFAKSSTVIIIDNSFSMDLSDESGNRFAQARNAAMEIINNLKEGDEAALLTIAEENVYDGSEFTRNFSYLKEQLSKIKISYSSANLENVLRKSSNLLENAVNLNKEIFIISDAQKNIFLRNYQDSSNIFSVEPAVYFVKIGSNSNNGIQNISLDSINVINRIFHYNKLVEVEIFIRNGSSKKISGLVVSMFFNNERVAQRNINIPAGEISSLNIAAVPQQNGLIKARIEIEEDALIVDNSRHFAFIIPDKPKIALIGKSNITNFLSLSLSGNSSSDAPAKIENFHPKNLPSINLSNYELLICAGGPYLKSDFIKIKQYVINGGSCLFFADEETNFKIFEHGISEFGFGNLKVVNFKDNSPGVFSEVDRIHPLFEGVFKGTTDKKSIVESPKIFKAYVSNNGHEIIKIPGGSFLSESRLGEGKVLYCAVTPDINWSSFPLTGLFPTLTFRTIAYLSSREGLAKSVIAGTPLMLSLPKKFASGNNFKIIDPKEKDFYIQAILLPSGAVLSLDNLNQLGIYSVISNNNKIIRIISVNPDKSESILSSLNDDEIITAIQSNLGEEIKLRILDNPKNIINGIDRLRTGTELWQLFILLSLLFVILEMIVAKNSKKEAFE